MAVNHENPRPEQRRRYRLGEAARRFDPSREGRPVGPGALKRWIEVGVKARNGGRIRLAAERLPSGWVVTDEAIRQFIDALTLDRLSEPAQDLQPRSVPEGGERAGRELAKHRI